MFQVFDTLQYIKASRSRQYNYLKPMFASPPRTLMSRWHINNGHNVSDLFTNEKTPGMFILQQLSTNKIQILYNVTQRTQKEVPLVSFNGINWISSSTFQKCMHKDLTKHQ